ncbi:DEAD/DEAH box helicase [Engelhardtia mirabilis]|uniref:Calcineurin-like phosphoesterase domain-containing protein n=1 Tax=Engelhardtia mirabilis TaxID=2528011 RepID=A0A518BHZ2_9BACT|nr:hypothetical protein Pla133_16750 [Planctomycetes bacterium Pla133]QDV00925.1 hypothetical protein Pla86_16740 [Planctomycetes bacterium Pla86]
MGDRENRRAPRTGARRVEVGGQELWLLAERAAWWPLESTLLVSDLHLGRPPTDDPYLTDPTIAAAADLSRLGELLDQLGARRLWILGDLRHSSASGLGAADEVLAVWLAARGELEIHMVRGNQDEAAGDPSDAPGLHIHAPGRPEGPLTLHHYPPEPGDPGVSPAGWVAGHLHPAATFGGPRDAPRAPAFLVEGRGLVLPAFGSGTHAHPVRRRPDQHLFPIRNGIVERPIDLERHATSGRSNPGR